ncbi:hypothetical protein BGZ60DRAFT_432115 [Tricladium varicosporioides]|nr:hypothetical protein BGZ60DRAFT_432115 [Hymenoscyphus varicosporioides]
MAPLERYSLNMASPPALQAKVDGNNNKPSRGIRHATDPLLTSQQKKENIAPTAGLLRPISPTQTRLHTLPKSRTMSTMQRLTSTLSRSNLNLSHISSGRKSSSSSAALAHIGLSSSRSANSLVTAAPTTALSDITVQTSTTLSVQRRIPIPKSPLDLLDVYEAMPSTYWSGRLQSLYDRYGTEMIQETIDNPVMFARCVAPTPKGFVPPSHLKSKPKEGPAKVPIEDTIDTERLQSSLFLDDQSDERYIKAFSFLRIFCKTDEAAQSLWDFQQKFARKEKKAALLPLGGTMGGWRGILTKGRKSERESERGTSLGIGRRTGLSRTFAKRANEVGLGETF